jgi:hypothetical protein
MAYLFGAAAARFFSGFFSQNSAAAQKISGSSG